MPTEYIRSTASRPMLEDQFLNAEEHSVVTG